jgi:hypothetical protein
VARTRSCRPTARIPMEVDMPGSTEFHVKLDGIKLPADVENRIAAEVQATVMRELAQVKLTIPEIQVRIPKKEWLGLWAEEFKGGTPLPTPTFIEGK